jgi:hypothetical protein
MPKGLLCEFYLPPSEWPPVYAQGDMLDGVPRVLVARDGIPTSGALDAPVAGQANYCHTRAVIISPTCNIARPEILIQFASVRPAPSLSKDDPSSLLAGRHHRQFLLPDLAGSGDHVVYLTDVCSLPRAHFAKLARVACVSAWGHHLLGDALYRAFARPIVDPAYDTSVYAGCLPQT